MRNLIIAATMIVPILATGAVAATYKQAAEGATCTFEPATGTYGHCGRLGGNRASQIARDARLGRDSRVDHGAMSSNRR